MHSVNWGQNYKLQEDLLTCFEDDEDANDYDNHREYGVGHHGSSAGGLRPCLCKQVDLCSTDNRLSSQPPQTAQPGRNSWLLVGPFSTYAFWL